MLQCPGMWERERFNLAKMTAEMMYNLWELDHQQNGRDRDGGAMPLEPERPRGDCFRGLPAELDSKRLGIYASDALTEKLTG
jgi:hypothetical protein